MLFASGSPFDPIVDAAGVTHYPAQANNAYIFPAVGYAAVLAQAREITDEVRQQAGINQHGHHRKAVGLVVPLLASLLTSTDMV